MGDVVLGYRDEASYLGDGPCMGKIPGRYANRIAGGRFCLDGKWFDLVKNHPVSPTGCGKCCGHRTPRCCSH